MNSPDQDELLQWYKNELAYLRQTGAEFAEKYPQIARGLNMKFGEVADPHIERLVESFALLTGRIQYNFDQRFPEITSALLELLYPHYLHPVPSMTISRFEIDPAQAKVAAGWKIPRGTPLAAYSDTGETCRFRTCYATELWPLEIIHAGFEETKTEEYPHWFHSFPAVLKITLRSISGPLSQVPFSKLRFYLDGDSSVTSALYQHLFGDATRAAIKVGDSLPYSLPEGALTPVGFAPDEDVLFYPGHSHPGFRLLQEYFAFSEKFQFFDLSGLDVPQRMSAAENTFHLLFFLTRPPESKLKPDKTNFSLGCVPVTNLFRKTTEPLRLDHRSVDYRLVPDHRHYRTTEIHSIIKVSGSPLPEDEKQVFQPYYSFDHDFSPQARTCFWHAKRTSTGRAEIPGSDIRLSFLDRGLTPSSSSDQTVYAHTWCTNRGLAEHLPTGALLQLEEPAPCYRITCLRKPTQQWQPPLPGETRWRLVSHLALSQLSLCEGTTALSALKEILRVYNFTGSSRNIRQINGVLGLSSRRIVRRAGREAWRGFCRGLEMTLSLDEQCFKDSSAFAFSLVLQHFLASISSVQSFVQLAVKSSTTGEHLKQWPPMTGEKIVL